MDKNWFACFSMLFWCITKVIGLVSLLFGLYALTAVLSFEAGWFRMLLFSAILPIGAGFVLLATELAFDFATAVMRGRFPQS